MTSETEALRLARDALAFFSYVIKSGEPWTKICEGRLRKTLAAIDAALSEPTPAIPDEAVEAAAMAACNADPGSDRQCVCLRDGRKPTKMVPRCTRILTMQIAALTAALPLMTGDNQAAADVIRAKDDLP